MRVVHGHYHFIVNNLVSFFGIEIDLYATCFTNHQRAVLKFSDDNKFLLKETVLVLCLYSTINLIHHKSYASEWMPYYKDDYSTEF